MTDEGWVRDKLFAHAAELGAQSARQTATDASVTRIGEEMKAGFAAQRQMMADAIRSMEAVSSRESAHVREEISRLDQLYREQRKADEEDHERRQQEERRRADELIASLKETAERSELASDRLRVANRRIIFVVVFIGACASAFVENAPALFNFVGNVLNGVN